MLNKVVALARIVAILLAVIAGFVVIPNLNVGLAIAGLALISGFWMPAERMLPVGMSVLVLPASAAALALIPSIGTQLAAVATNVALAAAAAMASAIGMRVFESVKEGIAQLGAKA